MMNAYYKSHEDYLMALAREMRPEYLAIHEAGHVRAQPLVDELRPPGVLGIHGEPLAQLELGGLGHAPELGEAVRVEAEALAAAAVRIGLVVRLEGQGLVRRHASKSSASRPAP